MLAVQLDDKSGFVTVKIGYIGSDGFLPLKADGTGRQEPIPKAPLSFGHILAQVFGKGDILLFVGQGHENALSHLV